MHAYSTNMGFAEMVDESVRIQAGVAHTVGTISLGDRQVMIRQSATRLLFTKHSGCPETNIPICSCNSSTKTQADAQKGFEKADFQKFNKGL